MNRVINDLIESAFSIENPAQYEQVKRLKLAQTVFNQLEWSKINSILDELQQKPLTRQAKMDDLLANLIALGLNSHLSENLS